MKPFYGFFLHYSPTCVVVFRYLGAALASKKLPSGH